MTGKRKLEGRALGRDIGAIIGKPAAPARRAALPAAPTKAAEKAAAGRVANAVPGGAVTVVERDVSHPSALPTAVQNASSLAEAVGYTGKSEQVVSTDTLFKNLRWYLVSNFRQALSQAYIEIGLIQTIVDVPVDDALRGGVSVKSQQLTEDEIKELVTSLKRDGDIRLVGQAAKWNRLFGGGAVLVITEQDPTTPLNVDAITEDSLMEFRAVDLWELNYSKLQASEGADGVRLDDGDDNFDAELDDCYDYYGHKIHKSRVLKMKGIEPPSFVRPRMRGWGVSVVETLIRSINQYLKGTSLGFEVLDEFKLDVFKIKGLTNTLMSPGGREKIATRINIAAYQKNYQSAIVMDAEDDYENKQLSFTGLADAMASIRMQIASDMRMPLTKLFGISAAGFNSGEDDIEVYNGMVEGQVREPLESPLLSVIELKCQKLFGFVPDDLSLEFEPLRVLSAVDEETVKTQKFNRLLAAKERGEITVKEFRDACNKGGLLDISLDTSEGVLAELEATAAAEAAAALPGATGDEDDDMPPAPPTGKGGKSAPPKAKDAPEPKALNAFDEGKHPRADDGKFGAGGASAAKEKFQTKWPDAGAYHSSGDRDTTTKTARELRKDGVHATIWHVGGPKTGAKSEYVVAVPQSTRNAGESAAPDTPVLSQAELAAVLARVAGVQRRLKPYTTLQRVERVLKNSAAFDKASYEADGGDAWIDPRRKEFFTTRPVNIDVALWERATAASREAFGEPRWQFVAWYCRKFGGRV